ncbi:TSUP family transporter [Candidatus Micrarchaeota archaeon]|nr:TSUP family transporter [Candidatus Micrarchaeota archaeon]
MWKNGVVELELLTIALIFVTGLVASFIGTNVGGGGMIVIPALIALGFPPKAAIATMRVGSCGLLTGGTAKFHEKQKIDYNIGIPSALLALAGAYFGATTLVELSNETVGRLVGFLMLVVLAFVIYNRDIGIEKTPRKGIFGRFLGYASFLLIGFYGGIFGGGTGIFAAYVLIFFFGQTFLEAAGTWKVPAIAIAAASLAIFTVADLVDWIAGATLLVSMLLGSYLGAAYAIEKGNRWVRALFILFVLAAALRLLF